MDFLGAEMSSERFDAFCASVTGEKVQVLGYKTAGFEVHR